MLNPTEIIVIGGVIILMFGSSKLPKLGGAVGESIKNFKKSIKDEEAPKLEDKNKTSENDPKG